MTRRNNNTSGKKASINISRKCRKGSSVLKSDINQNAENYADDSVQPGGKTPSESKEEENAVSVNTLQNSTEPSPIPKRHTRRSTNDLQTDISMTTDRNSGLTIPCTEEQYEEIIRVLWNGTYIIRRNRTIAIILQAQANLGLRIGDIMNLRLDDIIFDNGRYRFHMYEHKTRKKRIFTVPTPVYNMLYRYAKANGIKPDEKLFSMGIRNVQKKLDQVTDYLGYRYISSHSFRKRFALRAYEMSNFDANLVRTLLQHADTATTIRYLGVSDRQIERVLKKVVNIVESHWEGDDAEDGIAIDNMAHTVSNRTDMAGFRVDLPKSLIEQVDKYCCKEDMTLTVFMEEAIINYFEQHTEKNISANVEQ